MDSYYYGIAGRNMVFDIVKAVVEVLGGGSKAEELLLGTCAVETNFATYLDLTPDSAGFSMMQFDSIGFYDTRNRVVQYHSDWCEKIYEAFGVKIRKIELRDLKYSPLLALIFARLKYKLIPDPIPSDLVGQAKYWKKHYNSELGKGTVEKYIEKYKKYV